MQLINLCTTTLQELAPKVALQQLSLPTDDMRRQEGLTALRGFVWDADRTQLQRPRTEYMRDVRDQMTALEQVSYARICYPWPVAN